MALRLAMRSLSVIFVLSSLIACTPSSDKNSGAEPPLTLAFASDIVGLDLSKETKLAEIVGAPTLESDAKLTAAVSNIYRVETADNVTAAKQSEFQAMSAVQRKKAKQINRTQIERSYLSWFQNIVATPSDIRTLKPNYEAAIEKSAGKKLIYNREADKISDIYLTNKTQCLSGSHLWMLAAINKLGITTLRESHAVMIFSRGHILPGFVDSSKRLTGIETTMTDAALVDYGAVSQIHRLQDPIRVVDLQYYLLFQLAQSPLTKDNLVKKSLQASAIRYGFKNEKRISGSRADEFSFGETDQRFGDIARSSGAQARVKAQYIQEVTGDSGWYYYQEQESRAYLPRLGMGIYYLNAYNEVATCPKGSLLNQRSHCEISESTYYGDECRNQHYNQRFWSCVDPEVVDMFGSHADQPFKMGKYLCFAHIRQVDRYFEKFPNERPSEYSFSNRRQNYRYGYWDSQGKFLDIESTNLNIPVCVIPLEKKPTKRTQ